MSLRIDAHHHFWHLATHFGDYAGWLAACEDYCDRYAGDEDKDAVFGGNAYRFYRLEE
ncbi:MULTISPECIES: hypothetical protein [unclassified Paraburkholderia]|uniref:hypothetical protein n=1 Tax=unclassified Paraburkholderia TaxID=2615204 RepID=UPI001610556A|nr:MULTISPECIES: hypothetical protein [unclassified Paraburkholderia]MBB5460032.1 putative TIM-barrel fold metal-dependent hydrolase [Paraburkholderia sp. Cpub6]